MTHSTTRLPVLLAAAACACLQAPSASGAEADSVVMGTTDHWLMIPAVTFIARSSNMSHTYDGGGCIRAPYWTDLTHKLLLPDGALLRYVRTYFRDEGRGDLLSAVTTYDAQGSFEDLGLITTTNATGYSSVLSPEIAQVVDRETNAYAINVRFRDDDTILADGFETPRPLLFCGVRVFWGE